MRSIPSRWLTTVVAALLAMMAIDPGVSAQQPQPLHWRVSIVRLRHSGEWNLAPQAIPNLTTALRDKFKLGVVSNQKELLPRDPLLVHYPLLYLHGRTAVEFTEKDKAALRRHLSPGGGTLFADASGASEAFDTSFRGLIAELLPDHPLVPIPKSDDLYKREGGFNLANARRTAAAGGKVDFPDLEGVRIDGHWAVIYSRIDIGSALEKPGEIDAKGYTHQSALEIATNIVLDATLP